MKITIPYQFHPRAYQLPIFYEVDSGTKRIVIVWHRRSGKDETCLNVQIKHAWKYPGSHYYFFPSYSQGRKVLWEGCNGDGKRFMDHFPKELIIGRPREDDMQIRIKTQDGGMSTWQIVGVDNIDSIMGTNPISAVFSEFSLQHPRGWQMIRPILAQNGGWAIFNFTPRGNNHAKEMFDLALKNKSWYVDLKTVKNTLKDDGMPVLTEEQIDVERTDGMPEDLIQQEYYCSFSGSITGSYYGRLLEKVREDGRMTRIPYNANLLVNTYWDIGHRDSTAIWFAQFYNSEIRLIDYYEASGEALNHYIKICREKEYVYGQHFGPHDIEVKELTSGLSRREVAAKLGIRFRTVPRHPVDEGIDSVRRILPRCWFDESKCKRGLDALAQYHKEYDEKRRAFMGHPQHDWASHGADAFRTMAMAYRDAQSDTDTPRQLVADNTYTIFT